MNSNNQDRDNSDRRDWRDPSKPRNPEDDVPTKGWRRREDGTWEKIENEPNEQQDKPE
jgi:hypothetical protein